MEVEGQSPSPPSKKQRRTESKAGDDGDAGALSERVDAHLAAFEAQDLDGICQSYDEESVIVRWDWSEKKVRLFGVGVGRRLTSRTPFGDPHATERRRVQG